MYGKKVIILLFALIALLFCGFSYADSSQQYDVLQKISLTKEKDTFYLCIDFQKNINFTPRIHTLPNGIKVLLSFDKPVKIPKTPRLSHNFIKGYFFDRFSDSSLMFFAAFQENVNFIEKKYTRHAIKIGFKINHKHTVVIDAGHGGKDEGTHGITGDSEKNLTLITALELRNLLIKSGKYHVILTRDKDEFLSLEERLQKIKNSKAELLISIHTDSNSDKNHRGMSVYTLPSLKKITQTYGKTYSSKSEIEQYYKHLFKSRKFAAILMQFIPEVCKIKKQPCRNSELRLLKSNIPAVLIEVGCMSNKVDNELLHSKLYRDKLNRAIMFAADNFFKKGCK
ncbi:MAG: N-acetylmuramoyl-L-alanine amidase [Alphaproteobacteria bacterium]|nr:N-acetylmuramoyl-L-alanine amidase [Alphaproteobacteria bacterium]